MRSAEVIKKIEADGWYFVRQTGSHRHYRHPTKYGLATVLTRGRTYRGAL